MSWLCGNLPKFELFFSCTENFSKTKSPKKCFYSIIAQKNLNGNFWKHVILIKSQVSLHPYDEKKIPTLPTGSSLVWIILHYTNRNIFIISPKKMIQWVVKYLIITFSWIFSLDFEFPLLSDCMHMCVDVNITPVIISVSNAVHSIDILISGLQNVPSKHTHKQH